jgi:hypothetical protein
MAATIGGLAGAAFGAWFGWKHWAGWLHYTETIPKLVVTLTPLSVFALDGLTLGLLATGHASNQIAKYSMSGKADGDGWPGIAVFLEGVAILAVFSAVALGGAFIVNWILLALGVTNQLLRVFFPAIVSLVAHLLF